MEVVLDDEAAVVLHAPHQLVELQQHQASVGTELTSSTDQRAGLVAALEEGPKRDLRAIARRSQASIQVVRQMSWATYDRYLKTNRVSEGLASYDEAIALILASRPD